MTTAVGGPGQAQTTTSRLLGRLAEQAASLAQLVADLGEHREQLRQAGDHAALAALPTVEQLAGALLGVRQALKVGGHVGRR